MSATGFCSMTVFLPRGIHRFGFKYRFKRGRRRVTRCLLMVPIILSSVRMANAQVNNNTRRMPEPEPDLQLQLQAVVSANALQAPGRAQSALEKGREALERRRYAEARRRF